MEGVLLTPGSLQKQIVVPSPPEQPQFPAPSGHPGGPHCACAIAVAAKQVKAIIAKRIVVDVSVEHRSIEEQVMVKIVMSEIVQIETMMIEIVRENEKTRATLYLYSEAKGFFFQFQT